MNNFIDKKHPNRVITFYHDIEQNSELNVEPEICRQVVNGFLTLEKKYNVPATYNVVGKLFVQQPDLITQIINSGQEIAFHSFNHQPDWKPEYYADEIHLCRRVSNSPRGYRSPRSQWNQTTLKTLWELGFHWSAENDAHYEPYFIYEGLVRLPIAGDDWPLYVGLVNIEGWLESFVNIMKTKRYFAFGTHDFVFCHNTEKRMFAYESILKMAIGNQVQLVTFSEAADLFRCGQFPKDGSLDEISPHVNFYKNRISNYFVKISRRISRFVRSFGKKTLFH